MRFSKVELRLAREHIDRERAMAADARRTAQRSQSVVGALGDAVIWIGACLIPDQGAGTGRRW